MRKEPEALSDQLIGSLDTHGSSRHQKEITSRPVFTSSLQHRDILESSRIWLGHLTIRFAQGQEICSILKRLHLVALIFQPFLNNLYHIRSELNAKHADCRGRTRKDSLS
ncbi:hypothetical protein RRG08_008747 [Elysia crispata]|uniref:Uncharacterized protein n=1 Tax=Elysia crispata TaxID=231223 RepID=A0AAE0YVN4_9GAST|nr:hypothetical protein RRG08_008747 [Elysia crispata]